MEDPAVSLYEWLAFGASVLITVLLALYLRRIHGEHHSGQTGRPHLLVAVLLLVCAVGMTISSFGAFAGTMQMPVVGLSLVRGALLVGAIALFIDGRFTDDDDQT